MSPADPVILVPILAGLLMLWPALRICRRAGLPQSLGLLILIPYAGILVFSAALAHRRWPNQRPPRAKDQRQSQPRRSLEDMMGGGG